MSGHGLLAFSGPVQTEWLPDGVHMRVLAEIVYTDPNGHLWTVPAGFVTDGASIPQEFWSLIGSPFTGLYRVAAVFHDAAYANWGVLRDDADNMLRAAMLDLGCSQWLADTIYEGVRLGGEVSYEGDQRSVAPKVPAAPVTPSGGRAFALPAGP
jgi:hypothetical protein